MFYIKRNRKLCEKYKIIKTCINNKTNLSKDELRELIDFLPLKYIKIEKKGEYFIIDYSFKFLGIIFNSIYKKEIYELNKNKIINSNKKADIGNILDDLVNEKFSLGKTFDNFKIGHKIIVDTILNFDKLFNVLTDEKDNVKENDILFFEDIKQSNEIELDNLFNNKNAIFIEQYYQRENYDGAILIPIENNTGVYDIFLYQTSIRKEKKYYRNEIFYDYLKIKYNLESFFGITINKGYFSFILYYEEKDINTINRCKNEYLNYFFYSIEKKSFVDNNGNEIKSFIKDNSLIYKKDIIENLENVKKNIIFFENCFYYGKNKSINDNNIKKEKINFLGKKRILSSTNKENKILNLINKHKNLQMINNELKLKKIELDETDKKNNNEDENEDEEEEIKIPGTEGGEKNNLKKKGNKARRKKEENETKEEDENETDKNIEKLNSSNDKLEKDNKILFAQIYKESINDIDIENNKKDKTNSKNKDNKKNKENYNVREKTKYKILPTNIQDIFSNYKYKFYKEYGNKYFLGLNIMPKLPYVLICKENEKIIFLCYQDKENEQHIIDITTKKELDDGKKISVFNKIYFGKFEYYFWELL